MAQQIRCRSCQDEFVISADEAALRSKVSPIIKGKHFEFPAPTLCPDCRAQRRWSFRNEQALYRIECASCKKAMISVHRETGHAPIFCYSCWWSDRWDGMDFAMPIDWSRPIFEQVGELLRKVPECGIYGTQNENCDFNSQIAWSKNCYLCFLCYHSQGCLYSYATQKGTDIVDCYRTQGCEICYESSYLENCYRVHFSDHSRGCSDSAFLSRCVGCDHCFFCTNLRNARYCMFNRQLSPEEYENALAEFPLSSWQSLRGLKDRFETFRLKHPFPATHNESCENVSGDYLRQCQNCHHCFDLTNCRGCWHCVNFWDCTDSLDCVTSQTELGYECISGNPKFRVAGAIFCLESSNTYYSKNTMSSDSCFACVGLKRKKFCILNRQYTEAEYAELFPRLLEKMKTDGEYGEFLPASLSPFAYNESMANFYFPLSKEDVIARGWQWHDEAEHIASETPRIVGPDLLPDDIQDAGSQLTGMNLECLVTGKRYRIIPQELEFLKREKIALPRVSPDFRRKHRAARQNPRQIVTTRCTCNDSGHAHGAECGNAILCTYPASPKHIVRCDPCYLKSVY